MTDSYATFEIIHYRVFFHKGIDYAAALGLGAFMGSTTYLLIYALVVQWLQCGIDDDGSGNTTAFLRFLLLSAAAGALCATGQVCWLVANEALQASITFPIAASLPGALATLLGTLFFREVQVPAITLHEFHLTYIGC